MIPLSGQSNLASRSLYEFIFHFSIGLVEGSDIRSRRDGSDVTKKLGFGSGINHTVSTRLVTCIGQIGLPIT
jgi:hypothetical protein